MYQFNKKQKIIACIVVSIIGIAICYYVYAKEENSNEIEEILAIENQMSTEDTKEEKTQEEKEIIIIHVAGCVQKEGIYELEENSRVQEAIKMAGGTKEDANLANINLAEILEDGMKLYIPSKTEQNESIENNTTKNPISNNAKENTSKVNINTATQSQLETLPGIGPSTALKIIQYRKEKGKFSNKEQIKEVSGIGEAKYQKIKDYIVTK